jgi:hypothetical protein
MTKTRGSNRAAIDARRLKVQQYYLLAALGANEIATLLHVDDSTIRRDLEEMQESLKANVEAAQLWPIKKHVSLLEEILHQAGRIFLRPKEKRVIQTKDGLQEVEIDDSFRKLAALDRMFKVAESLARITSVSSQNSGQPQQEQEEKIACFINSLPTQLRNAIIAHLQEKTRLEQSP